MENPAEQHNGHSSGHEADATSPKYGLRLSLQELLVTVKGNPRAFTAALIASYVISGIVIWLVFLAMARLLVGEFGLLFASFQRIITVLVVGLIVYTLLYALAYAFTIASLAYTLSPERNSAVDALKKALDATPRVLKVNIWVAIITYWPVALAIFLPILALAGPRTGNISLALFYPLLLIGAAIWAIIANLRYAIAPYIALFEPDVRVTQTLKRSQELLKNGGQWFIFKGFLLVTGLVIVLALASKSNYHELQNTDNLAINAIIIMLSVLVEGVLVMLYFNRSGRSTPTASQSAIGRRMLMAVIAVLIGLFGVVAYQSKAGTVSNKLTPDEEQAATQRFEEAINKHEIDNLASALEGYYDLNGFYPSASNLASRGWASKNLRYTVYKTSLPINDSYLIDSNGNLINAPNSDLQYKASPENCTKCSSYEISRKLQAGEVYKKTSLNNTVKTTTTPIQTPTSPPSAQQPLNTRVGTAYVTYRMDSDANLAQLSPVTTTLSDVGSVELTVELQCQLTCQFKLASDTYTFSNTTRYTSNQKIKYIISKPGEYVLYNQYLPNTKFTVKF